MVVFSPAPLSPHLTCRLCSGYFRDPVTITECLHTFCKSCLYYAFSSGYSTCPTCNVDLGTYPFRSTLADRTLQELVDKVLFPELKQQDDEKEKLFYAKKGIELKEEFRESEHQHQTTDEEEENENENQNENENENGEDDSEGRSGEKKSVIEVADDDLEFSMIPETEISQPHEMGPLERPRLRTSGRIKVVQLKKYLLRKLKMESIDPHAIDVLCNGIVVGNELSLTFINRTIWVDVGSSMELTYKLAEEF